MFKRNLLKLFCLLLLAGISTSALAVNESEPNDVWNQADVITLGATGTGTAGLAQENDWWRVNSATDGKLTVNWTATNGLNVFCQIYDTLGVLQFASAYTAGSSVLNVDGLTAGTYYIKFFAYYGNQAPNYSFIPSWTTPAQANDVEPNGTRNQAKVLNVNSTKTGHIGYYYNNLDDTLDWYKITTTLEGAIKWTITSNNGLNIFAELFDNDGVTKLGGNYTPGSATYTVDGLSAGTYYIRVRAYYIHEFAPYTLTDSLILPPVQNDAEPNGVYTQALTFNLNDTVRGHSGYYYNFLDDTLDWYKVTTTKDGRLNYQIYSLNGQNIFLQLYDGNGTTLLAGGGYTSGTATYNTDGLAAGTYYFRLRTYYNNEWVPYKFIVKLIEPARIKDAEPNNTKAQAKSIGLNDSITGHAGYQYNGVRDQFDYRKVTLTSNGKLEWTISSENGQNIFARLYDNNGTTIIPGSNGGYTSTTATYSADGLAPGTYYLLMHTYYNGYNDEWVPYYLKTKFYPSGNDVGEYNGTYANAAAINLNDSMLGSFGYYYNGSRDTLDWFKLTTNNDGHLTIKLYHFNTQNAFLDVYDNNGTTVLFSQYNCCNVVTYSATNLAKGTYYIRVRGYYSNEFAAYALVNTLDNNNGTDPEPDNYAKVANKINGYSTREGNINYRQNGGTFDLVDWWKIAYYNLGNLDITVNKVQHTFDANYPDIVYRLYLDTTLAPLDSVALVGGANLTYNHVYTGLSAATYYIRITQLNNTYGGYSIKANYRDTTSQTVTLISDVAGTTCGAGELTYYITRGKPPYSVQLYKDGVASGSAVNTSDTAKFTSLNAGYYSVTTRSTTAATYTVASKDTTVVPKPVGLSTPTASLTTTSAILKWTGLACVDGYRLQWRLKGTTAWTTIFQPAGATQDTIYGLSASTQYQFRVTAYVTYIGATKYYGLPSTVKTFTTPAVRLADNSGKVVMSEMEVYPNPVIDKINFVVDDASAVIQITISNAIGQQVMVINNNVDLNQALDVSSLQQGIYFVTIKTSANLYTTRFVKE